MQIITLTTDFGWKDYYVGKLKGYLLRENTTINIIDITHDVTSFNTIEGTFILKHCYKDFPLGTIHILSVNNFYAENPPRMLAIFHKGYYFLGPDNGQFSLLFDGEIPEKCYELVWEKQENKTPIEILFQTYAKAVAHLTQQLSIEEIGIPNNWILQRISLQPIIGKDFIRAAIIHIDKYENVILNITREVFERIGKGRKFQLFYRNFDPITKLSQHYGEVAIGDVLCIFNAAGLLEIAINLAKASSLLDLHKDELVEIQFLD